MRDAVTKASAMRAELNTDCGEAEALVKSLEKVAAPPRGIIEATREGEEIIMCRFVADFGEYPNEEKKSTLFRCASPLFCGANMSFVVVVAVL